MRTAWVADLHLFSSRSDGHRHRDSILAAAAGSDVFVLGGDIFDFSWTTLPTLEETVERAVAWLTELAAHAPNCRFHYVLGNHDYHQPFIDRLREVEKTAANFAWQPFFLRLGNSMFLHGDVANRPMTARTLKRSRLRGSNFTRKAPLQHTLYDLAVSARLHVAVPAVLFRDRLVARRILWYLNDVGHGRGTGLRQVYFGHTHVALSHYEFEGVMFHNGGAPMKGLPFRILTTEMDA